MNALPSLSFVVALGARAIIITLLLLEAELVFHGKLSHSDVPGDLLLCASWYINGYERALRFE